MKLTDLEQNYEQLLKVTRYTHKEDLADCYLKAVLVIGTVMIPDMTLDEMKSLWEVLPQAAAYKQAEHTLNPYFKIDRVFTEELPLSVQSTIATLLLTGSSDIPWYQITIETIKTLVGQSTSFWVTNNAKIAQEWLERSDPEVRNHTNLYKAIPSINKCFWSGGKRPTT